MITRSRMLRSFPRSAVLASCLLGLLPGARAADASGQASYGFSKLILGAAAASESSSWQVPGPRTVDNCNDDGSPGTLRAEIDAAADGETIDLSQLACSTITLGSPIQILQNSLILSGPGADNLTIIAGNDSLLFQQLGIGTFGIDRLKITNGYHFNTGPAKGGCIYSVANVTLTNSVVSNCVVASSTSDARGGGIYTAGDLTLVSSTITGNHALTLAVAPGYHAYGGGAYVSHGNFHSKYSTISNNSAHDFSPHPTGFSGGIWIWLGGTQIENSTISGNTADQCAAIFAGSQLSLTNSTISGNSAEFRPGICGSQIAITLTNSTVAFNKSSTGGGGGLSIYYTNLTLQSSIVADNIGSSDIKGSVGFMVLGSNNLVGSSNLQLPPDTIHDCPKLDRLADNGGGIRTHALRLGSPAIDYGNNDAGLIHDERGAPRVTGTFADIGAFERQVSDVDERIFFDNFDDGSGGPCDQ
jgi:hypothetical protein